MIVEIGPLDWGGCLWGRGGSGGGGGRGKGREEVEEAGEVEGGGGGIRLKYPLKSTTHTQINKTYMQMNTNRRVRNS